MHKGAELYGLDLARSCVTAPVFGGWDSRSATHRWTGALSLPEDGFATVLFGWDAAKLTPPPPPLKQASGLLAPSKSQQP